MSRVTSWDGTTIGYERLGSGPAIILIDGALCSRSVGPFAKARELIGGYVIVRCESLDDADRVVRR